MKIGIVTINLNNKNGLEKTIQSVLSQTYTDYEYIIIDGMSTDGSVDIIKKYSDKISFWVSEKDNGIFNAMNKGIDACSSEYMLFLNSGDYLFSDKVLEDVYKELDCDIVYGNEEKRFKLGIKNIQKIPDVVDGKYFFENFLPHQSTFIKTSLLKEKKYREDYKMLGDWVFLKESIVDNNASYKHLNYVVSSYDCNGLSSDHCSLIKEKRDYYSKINNLNIFICSHGEFNEIVYNKTYKVINAKNVKDNVSGTFIPKLDDRFYSELFQFKYVADNLELPEYVGFCHYRRYFSFLDDIPDMDNIFSEYDAICSEPLMLNINVKEHYDKFHNIEDLYIIGGIIADKYQSYCNAWHNFINGNILIPYNMFIMKREDFKEYIDFIFSILDEYLKIVGTDINKRIYDNFEKYVKGFYPNNTVEYQYRIGGYAAERLSNLFMMYKFKKIKTYPVIVTEDKYNELKNSTI